MEELKVGTWRMFDVPNPSDLYFHLVENKIPIGEPLMIEEVSVHDDSTIVGFDGITKRAYIYSRELHHLIKSEPGEKQPKYTIWR